MNHNGIPQKGVFESDGSIRILEGEILGKNHLTDEILPIDQIKEYLVPIEVPNIIAIGLNYRDHAQEAKVEIPSAPLIFIKATSSLTAHLSPVILPKAAPDEVDYEAELVAIIGKTAKNITAEQAPDYIFGYTCGNDVSARDCQLRHDKQWARGKSFDTFAPIGPVIETDLDPADVRVRLILNGQCMQDASTRDLIFPVFDIVSYVSNNMTLLPGTVIMTGTPPGVGCARKPPVFLKSGDNMVVEVEGIGSLENHVILE